MSEASHKNNLQIIQLRKKYHSTKKMMISKDENKISEKHKSNKILNYYDKTDTNIKINNNNNSTDIKSKILLNLSKEQDFLKTYEKIKYTIENFIQINKGNNKLIYRTLNQIFTFINSQIASLNKNNDIVNSKNNYENSNDNWVDFKSKILYEMKIHELYIKIKELNHQIELLNMNDESKNNFQISKKFGVYNSLKRKIIELESKLKLNEFNYLLCIKEQQKKIADLEKELNMKKIEAEFGEMKETRCFPYLTQYNYKEDINPKSVPLTKSILKTVNSEKKRKRNENQNLKNANKDSFLNITNSISNTNKNIFNEIKPKFRKTSYDSNLFKKLFIKNIGERDNKGYKRIKHNSDNAMTKYVNFLKINNINNLEEEEDFDENNNSSLRAKKLSSRLEKEDLNLKNIKEYTPENIMNKEKKYFISHPNLTLAGIDNKKNKFTSGLPNKIFSFKFSKKLEKNAFFTFPSTLNETLVNLEKLRINKNYLDKEDIK